VKSRKADIASMKKSPHVPLRQIAEERRRRREGARSGVTHEKFIT
jgi:hypothetical protein